MPPDLRAGRVALDEDLRELVGLDLGELRRPLADGNEPLGDRLRLLEGGAALVVVVDAEVPRGALRDDAVHPDLVEVEPLELVEQRLLLVLAEQLRLVDEPVRRRLDVPSDAPRVAVT